MATPLSLASTDVTTAPTDPNAPIITTDAFDGDDLASTVRPATSGNTSGTAVTFTPSSTGLYVSVQRTGLEPYDVVGASWSGDTVGDAAARTSANGTWTQWIDVHASRQADGADGEAPAPERTTTEPVWAGNGDGYEFVLPVGAADVQVHVVRVPDVATQSRSIAGAAVGTSGLPATGAPPIFGRDSWGAAGPTNAPSYASTVRVAFVHHTASSNTYNPNDVPSLLRGFQSFHQNVNGWSDIGYNFLVDRWGRIWEGRAGGIDRAVIGAHAGGFNTTATGVALIGDFTSSAPPSATLNAVVSLLAWKMPLTNADPNGLSLQTSGGSSRYAAGTQVQLMNVSGHRDVSLTACPGGLAYNQIQAIANAADARIAFANPWPGAGFGLAVAGGQRASGAVVALAPARFAPPHVQVYSDAGQLLFNNYVYPAGFFGGVRLAMGELDSATPGDELVTTPGPGGGPQIDVWRLDGTKVRSFAGMPVGYGDGLYIAVGNVVGNADEEIIATTDAGGAAPTVSIFALNGTLISRFWADSPSFRGGLRVAVGNLDGDVYDEIVTTPGPGGQPVVNVFNGDGSYVRGFYAYASSLNLGLSPAVLRSTDGNNRIAVSTGVGGGPNVATFTATGANLARFISHSPSGIPGTNIASLAVAGADDILITAPVQGGVVVRTFSWAGWLATPLGSRVAPAP